MHYVNKTCFYLSWLQNHKCSMPITLTKRTDPFEPNTFKSFLFFYIKNISVHLGECMIWDTSKFIMKEKQSMHFNTLKISNKTA